MRRAAAAAGVPGSMLISVIEVWPGSGRNSQRSVCIRPVFKCPIPVQTDGPALLWSPFPSCSEHSPTPKKRGMSSG